MVVATDDVTKDDDDADDDFDADDDDFDADNNDDAGVEELRAGPLAPIEDNWHKLWKDTYVR